MIDGDHPCRTVRHQHRNQKRADSSRSFGVVGENGILQRLDPTNCRGDQNADPASVCVGHFQACILDRCRSDGTLAEAIAEVSAAKRGFTEADVYARASMVLEKCILQGTTRIRSHVEVDPRVGLRSFAALQHLKRDYAWAADLELCVFPQEGLTNDPGTEELLEQACAEGADVIGGCPYTDSDPKAQIERIFAIARRFDLDIDFHLDFDLDPRRMDLDEVCRQTAANRWGGRVTVGHVTKLSALPGDRLAEKARRPCSGLSMAPPAGTVNVAL